MKTIRLNTENSQYSDEIIDCVVNVNRWQLRGIEYLYKVSSRRFYYYELVSVNEEQETAETLWNKFFCHLFGNKALVLQRLEGNLK